MLFRKRAISILLTVFILTIAQPVWAQKESTAPKRPSNCERIASLLDGAANEYLNNKEPGKVIIIASSRSFAFRRYDESRINQAKRYLIKYFGLKPDQIVSGITRSPNKLSSLQIYVGGDMVGEIFVGAKRSLCRGDDLQI
jgi:hypothetical protein